MGLSFNINFQSGLKLHSEVILPDDNSFKPALYQGLVEGFQVCGLLLDKILQFIDAGNLCVSGGGINRALFALFPELGDLVLNPQELTARNFSLVESFKSGGILYVFPAFGTAG